jgi:hypothetical protein
VQSPVEQPGGHAPTLITFLERQVVAADGELETLITQSLIWTAGDALVQNVPGVGPPRRQCAAHR